VQSSGLVAVADTVNECLACLAVWTDRSFGGCLTGDHNQTYRSPLQQSVLIVKCSTQSDVFIDRWNSHQPGPRFAYRAVALGIRPIQALWRLTFDVHQPPPPKLANLQCQVYHHRDDVFAPRWTRFETWIGGRDEVRMLQFRQARHRIARAVDCGPAKTRRPSFRSLQPQTIIDVVTRRFSETVRR
jgi:hypothetical protein